MADGIEFNNIPGSGLTAPLMAFEFNSGGQPRSGTRMILVGHATTAGAIAPLVPTPPASQDDADRLAGPGSMLREMYRVTMENAPAQDVWLLALPEAGIVETRTITIGALPGPGVAVLEIEGETLAVTAGLTDTPATLAAALAAAINGYFNLLTGAMLPLTAAVPSGAPNTVLLTMRHAGAIMSDVDVFVPTTTVANNLFAQPGVFAIAVTLPGAGVPVVAAALAALGDDPADFVVSPWSDPVSLAAYTTWANDQNGRWAWARQDYGHVWTSFTGTYAAMVTLGLGLNDRHSTIFARFAGTPRASWLCAAAYCATHAPWLSDCTTGNVSRSQSGKIIAGLAPPRSRAGWPQYQARNGLVNAGLSTWRVDGAGNMVVDKAVTTYRTGRSGQPDIVFRDVQRMYQLSGGFTFIRAVLAQEQGQKAFALSNPGSLAAISTPDDIASTSFSAYKILCKRGVFQDFDAFVRGFVAQPNADNPDRCDIFGQYTGVNPLDIIAANATIYSVAPGS